MVEGFVFLEKNNLWVLKQEKAIIWHAARGDGVCAKVLRFCHHAESFSSL